MLHYHLGLVLTLKWLGCRNYYKLLISLCVNIFKEVQITKSTFKGIVHPKMNILLSLITHPHVVPNL